MAFMVVRGSVWPGMEFWTGQGDEPGSQGRQEEIAPQGPPTGLSPGHSRFSAALLGAAGSLRCGSFAPGSAPPPAMGPSLQVHSRRDGGRAQPWATGPGQLGLGPRKAPDNCLSLLPVPSSCPVVGTLHPGGTWGQGLESPG